jgi:RNA polymerase sigma factor (sigma-70 family)
LDPLNDNYLMLGVKNGDLGKMGLLFERYQRPLFSYLYNLTGQAAESEDLVQTVFYLMLKNRQSFSADGAFRAWMYQIARNTLINTAKKNSRMIYRADATESDSYTSGQEPLQNLDKKELKARLDHFIARLPEDQREALVLAKYQELPYNEIAVILKTTEGNVKIKVFRALQALKKLYKKN